MPPFRALPTLQKPRFRTASNASTGIRPGRGARTLNPKALSLDHFLQRQRVLSLWRDVVRATLKVSDAATGRELRGFARQEFEQHRSVADLAHIRYLVSTGREQLRSMGRYVEEMGGRGR